MTGQIADTVSFEGEIRAISAVDGIGLFNPREHGIEPFAYSTACHRGYHCAYLVDGESLYLTRVHIGLQRPDERAAQLGRGPQLFGKIPQRYIVHGHRRELMTGKEISSWESPDHRVDGLHERMPFTGGLLLVADFIESMRSHHRYHAIYKFAQLHELRFDTGRLLEARDLSAQAQAFRQRHPPRTGDFPKLDEHERVQAWLREHLRCRYVSG